MNKLLTIAAACVALLGNAAYAGLDVGEKAPDFKTDASLGGNVFKFSLADALKKGPVVLYFYPAAFSVGCTVEAHEFAEATDTFKQLGATVIGVSHDDIETLKKFSVTECRNKFAVASDGDQSIMKSYDAVLALKPEFKRSVEGGVELSFLNGRLGLDATVYRATTKDQIVENLRGSYGNGFILFNYQSATSFDFAGFFAGSHQWVIGHRNSSDWISDIPWTALRAFASRIARPKRPRRSSVAKSPGYRRYA